MKKTSARRPLFFLFWEAYSAPNDVLHLSARFLLGSVRACVVKGRGYFSVLPTTLSEVFQENDGNFAPAS